MRLTTPMFAASLLAPLPALAQSNLERVVNGDYTPSHDFDLLHQRIEVKNFDWDSTSFDGRIGAGSAPGTQRISLCGGGVPAPRITKFRCFGTRCCVS